MAKATNTTKATVSKSTVTKLSDKAIEKKSAAVSEKSVVNKPAFAKPVFEKPKTITDAVIQECKEKLLNAKFELLNRVKEARGKLDQFERGGDEADQTMRILAEQEVMSLTDRLRQQLLEIESALGRIEGGAFGYCEETEEPIEIERLRAIPWTRLSIEGAEIRESVDRRYARS